MKKLTKKDIGYMWIVVLAFLSIVFILSNNMYMYGSQLDWYAEHVTIPEYFRTLFYSTKDLFPDFAANIGNGQNIYNLSYYGFLSPIVLLSYLMPSVSMNSFIIVSTIITVIISSILIYIFFKKKDYKSEICLIAAFIFITSAAISLHSHRHIMFINYFPFLLLGLFGIDKKINDKKGWLLSLSVFLMIMTSYYFSIGGIICLLIYGIYKIMKKNKVLTFKSFVKPLFSLLIPITVGILSSSIITIPTLATLLNNRAESNVYLSLKDVLFPSLNTEYLLYDTYGIGLTAIAIPSIINLIKNKKHNIFLGIVLSLLIIFPLFNYILNGTMYIDSKTLIPFLPLYIYAIVIFVKDIFENNVNYKVLIPTLLIVTFFVIINHYKTYKYLLDISVLLLAILIYHKSKKKVFLVIPILLCSYIACIYINKGDELVLKYTTNNSESIIKNSINKITDSDSDFYRIANDYNISETPNKNYENINYYNSTIYSSISNQTYNSFYYDIMNNNIPSRNRALTVTTDNIMSLILNNNKYIVSRNKELQGYELVESNDGLNIYKNENVMPLGFATSNVMNYEDFERLANPVKQEALLNLIVADTETKNDFVSSVQKIDLKFDEIFSHENLETEDGTYTITATETLKIKYKLPEEYQNKILFIRFTIDNEQDCSIGDRWIKINNVKNKLTCSTWKYYNENKVFDFVLAEKDLIKLNISLSSGTYNIKDFEIYALDYANIENVSNRVSKFVVNNEETKGDTIKGNIDVKEDSYFMLTIPYDKGFNISVDNKKVTYEKVDNAYIGFKLEKGKHDINIEYKAPLKDLALIISSIGFLSFIVITILEAKRKI